jgi:hypothetical protein
MVLPPILVIDTGSEVDERRRVNVPFYIEDFLPYLQGIPLYKE